MICWTELATKDAETAKKFYSELLGWTLVKSEATKTEGNDECAGMEYTEFKVGDRPLGGIFQMTAEMGDKPSHWTSYVAVTDVDASAKRVEELGGKIYMPPTDIPNVGRFCIISDPTGATISLITLRPH
jgi:hypothetical protein